MTKTFLAGIMAASLAFTGLTAAPAQAEMNTQTRNLLIGLAATAIIAGAINNNRAGQAAPVQVQRNDWTPAPAPQRSWSRVLPAACIVDLNGRRGDIRIFSERCLDRNYRFADRLPEQCAIRVRTRDGRVNGYDPRCLRDAGFTTDRRLDWGHRGWGQGDWDRRDWDHGNGRHH